MVERELLQRNTIKEKINRSPAHFGTSVGHELWIAYAWVTRLQYGVLLSAALLSSFSLAWH